jgi:chromate transporter
MKFYWKLFIYTFQLSAFTFGGGYVIVPLMKKQFVEKLGWINEQEMLDFTAIAQSSPGAMAVNASVLLGYHLSGIPVLWSRFSAPYCHHWYYYRLSQ